MSHPIHFSIVVFESYEDSIDTHEMGLQPPLMAPAAK